MNTLSKEDKILQVKKQPLEVFYKKTVLKDFAI